MSKINLNIPSDLLCAMHTRILVSVQKKPQFFQNMHMIKEL